MDIKVILNQIAREFHRLSDTTRGRFELETSLEATKYIRGKLEQIENKPLTDEPLTKEGLNNLQEKLNFLASSTQLEYVLDACYKLKTVIEQDLNQELSQSTRAA